MLLFTLTISYVQVDLIGTHDLKLKLDQLQISFTKKEQEIDDHKRTIANLTNKMSQLEKTVNNLQALVRDLTSQVQISAEKGSIEEFEIFKWVISVDKLKQSEEYSKPFYVTTAPILLQVSAAITGKRLETWFYRCRGKNDSAGKILTDFRHYEYVLYLVNSTGDTYARALHFDANDPYLNIGKTHERSKGKGWEDFFERSTSNWNEWLIKNHLHFFCKLRPILIYQ